MPLGLPELLAILVILIVIFGPRRLPQLGRQLGSGMREFTDSVRGRRDEEKEPPPRRLAAGEEPPPDAPDDTGEADAPVAPDAPGDTGEADATDDPRSPAH